LPTLSWRRGSHHEPLAPRTILGSCPWTFLGPVDRETYLCMAHDQIHLTQALCGRPHPTIDSWIVNTRVYILILYPYLPTPSVLNYKSFWLFWYIHFAMHLDIIT
jgi:hypothetical protein